MGTARHAVCALQGTGLRGPESQARGGEVHTPRPTGDGCLPVQTEKPRPAPRNERVASFRVSINSSLKRITGFWSQPEWSGENATRSASVTGGLHGSPAFPAAATECWNRRLTARSGCCPAGQSVGPHLAQARPGQRESGTFNSPSWEIGAPPTRAGHSGQGPSGLCWPQQAAQENLWLREKGP